MPATPADRAAFSTACPRCGGGRIHPRSQVNNFDTVRPGGPVAVGDGHVSTSRRYACHGCGHEWAETVPYTEARA